MLWSLAGADITYSYLPWDYEGMKKSRVRVVRGSSEKSSLQNYIDWPPIGAPEPHTLQFFLCVKSS